VEEFPVRAGKECVWEKQVVHPDDAYAELLLSPAQAVSTFEQERPNDASQQDWHKHQFALRCIVAEICCTASGSTLLETLEPLLSDIKAPPPLKHKKKEQNKAKSHYREWRAEQKAGETKHEERERYLKLYLERANCAGDPG